MKVGKHTNVNPYREYLSYIDLKQKLGKMRNKNYTQVWSTECILITIKTITTGWKTKVTPIKKRRRSEKIFIQKGYKK